MIDLRSSMAFRAGHLRGSIWSTRSRLRARINVQTDMPSQAQWPIVLVACDP